jgi:hypothetical protein
MSDTSNSADVGLLYVENAKVAAIFWEWRHKVISRFFTAVAATAFASGWFYERPQLRPWIFALFLVAAIFSALSFYMDRVNTHILRSCYRIGAELETKFAIEAGTFKAISDIHYSRFAHYSIFRIVYLGSAVAFLALCILSGICLR